MCLSVCVYVRLCVIISTLSCIITATGKERSKRTAQLEHREAEEHKQSLMKHLHLTDQSPPLFLIRRRTFTPSKIISQFVNRRAKRVASDMFQIKGERERERKKSRITLTRHC